MELTSGHLLTLWESQWGALEQKWKIAFVNHPAVPEILKFPSEEIKAGIQEVKKLDSLLENLISGVSYVLSAQRRAERVPLGTFSKRIEFTGSLGGDPISLSPFVGDEHGSSEVQEYYEKRYPDVELW